MNLQQTKIILEKINTLHKSISLDAGNISAIERDLMLNYVRQLYDALLQEQAISQVVSTKPTRQTPPVIVKDIPTNIPPPLVEEIEKPARKKPRIVEVPDSIKEYAKPLAPVVVSTPPISTPQPEVLATPTASSPPKPKKEHEILFEQEEAKELSDRLSTLPIKDLTKAMGLNEKILTINELFGGDHRAFDEAIKNLNSFSTFDQAKDYLSENLAEKHNWADKSKKKKAQIFIKLIRRRYK